MMWRENRWVPNLPVKNEKVREFEIVNKRLAKMFDEDQQVAINLSNGHNFILSGQAGTGKTF